MGNDNGVLDVQRAREDELIRQYLLAEATEWAADEHKYGWLRELLIGAETGSRG